MAFELNLIGYVCPIPVFETRKKLLKMKKGEKLIGRKSLVDNTQNTQKEEIFDTFFCCSSKNVQMNKKH